MKPRKTVASAQQRNLKKFFRDGPRLSYGYEQYVIARDRKNGYVLLGGLGSLGVGAMWDFAKGHSKLPGYRHAPEEECPQYKADGNFLESSSPRDNL